LRGKNTTLYYLKMYFESVLQRVKEMRPCISWHGFIDVPLDLILWGLYLLCFIVSISESWSNGWTAKPIEKALTVGGWFIIIQLSIIILLTFFVIWKDLVDERQNNRPQSPITLKEILKKEIDFERWC